MFIKERSFIERFEQSVPDEAIKETKKSFVTYLIRKIKKKELF